MAKAGGSTSKKEDVFNVDRIRKLIDLMNEYELCEIDLKQDDQQIRLVRSSGAVPIPHAPAMLAGPVVASAEAASVVANAPQVAADDGPHMKIIKSPMVGTFYSRPSTKADEFVKVGTKISPEKIVCVIEAMKVFNEIPAEMSGRIIEVLIDSEEPVDFGRPLFKVDTRG